MGVNERHLAFLHCVSFGRLVCLTLSVTSILVMGSVTVRRGAISYGKMSKGQKVTKHALAIGIFSSKFLEGCFNIE